MCVSSALALSRANKVNSYQGSPLEYYLMIYLIEDGQGANVRDVKDMDYPDFLRHLHRSIQRIN